MVNTLVDEPISTRVSAGDFSGFPGFCADITTENTIPIDKSNVFFMSFYFKCGIKVIKVGLTKE